MGRAVGADGLAFACPISSLPRVLPISEEAFARIALVSRCPAAVDPSSASIGLKAGRWRSYSPRSRSLPRRRNGWGSSTRSSRTRRSRPEVAPPSPVSSPKGRRLAYRLTKEGEVAKQPRQQSRGGNSSSKRVCRAKADEPRLQVAEGLRAGSAYTLRAGTPVRQPTRHRKERGSGHVAHERLLLRLVTLWP